MKNVYAVLYFMSDLNFGPWVPILHLLDDTVVGIIVAKIYKWGIDLHSFIFSLLLPYTT